MARKEKKTKALTPLMEEVLGRDLQGMLDLHWAIQGPRGTINALAARGLIVIVGEDPLTARLTPAGVTQWERLRGAQQVAA